MYPIIIFHSIIYSSSIILFYPILILYPILFYILYILYFISRPFDCADRPQLSLLELHLYLHLLSTSTLHYLPSTQFIPQCYRLLST